MSEEPRCTDRKHVQERGKALCDCGKVMARLTAGKNAHVVTILDPLQAYGLATWAKP